MHAAAPAPSPAPHPDSRVLVALSGGVDSAVALALARRAGLDVVAVFMKNWDEDDGDPACPAAADLDDARRVCDRLGVELHAVSCSHEYWERVFTPFLAEYRAGRTPNPDVPCNREIKFGALLEHAERLGAGVVATGHYARVRIDAGRRRLLRGTDRAKDQSYFLHALDQDRLARAWFPVGGLDKAAVRRIARAAGLAPHDKPDSTGICFIGERRFRAFLARWVPPSPGPIESVEGERVGEHAGLPFYTIGQRRGLGIGGRTGAGGAPWYVAGKDRARNTLLVAQGRDHPALRARALDADRATWIAGAAPPLPLRCTAQIRHRQPAQPCLVTAAPGGLRVEFEADQWGPAPGQAVAFYCADECLGGARIRAVAGATPPARPGAAIGA